METFKTKLLIGSAASGKTRYARDQADGKKAFFSTCPTENRLHSLLYIPSDTELLVIDEIPEKLLERVIKTVMVDKITVTLANGSLETFDRPPIIFVCQCPKSKVPSVVNYKGIEVVNLEWKAQS